MAGETIGKQKHRDNFARRRKLAWHRKGRQVISRVPIGAPLWELKYRRRGISPNDLYAKVRTSYGVRRQKAVWVLEDQIRGYLVKPYSKQEHFDELMLELKRNYRIESVTPRYLRNVLKHPANPREELGIPYTMRPIRVTPKLKTKISRSLVRSKVLSKQKMNGKEWFIKSV